MTLVLIALGLLCGWLAWDAWCLRGGAKLPYAELLKLRGESAHHLSLQERQTLQAAHERKYGRTDAMFLVFAILGLGCLAAAVFRQLG